MIRATHLFRRTLIPIIVPIENDRLLRRRCPTPVPVIKVRQLVVFLVRNVTEAIQSPKTRRPLHAHASPRRSISPIRVVVLGRGILEFPVVRHGEFPNAI